MEIQNILICIFIQKILRRNARRIFMKLTVGGSFHEPGWTAVCETVKKLKAAGHEILAPR